MTDAVYARSVRRNLATLLVYAETVQDYPRRHAAEMREALQEALDVATRMRMSSTRVLMITMTSVVMPVRAMRQVERFLADAEATHQMVQLAR